MRPASERALLSEPTPNSTFPTDQVPPPAMRDTTTAAAPPLSAPTVQDPREQRGAVAGPPATSCASREPSVIAGPSNLRTQSVTHDSISNDSVTVPNTQRNAPNNSSKLDRLDIPQYLNNDKLTFDRLLALTFRTRQLERRGLCPPMRLAGGGESAATGWGTPPSNNTNNNNANSTSGWGTANPANQGTAGTQQWNNNPNRTAPTAQDTNKSNPNSNLPQGQQPPSTQPQPQGWGPSAKPPAVGPPATVAPVVAGAPGTGAPPPNSTKQQLEQLTNMREAIFSQDGWGGQHVNQDTTWDIPSSPEPPLKMDATGAPQWKPNVNNGTELWEANLRNGGQPPPQPAQKTPWGHTPTTNIGGTWGEDDDASDSSNVWTGVPNNQPQWSGNPATASGGAMWPAGPKKDSEWGGSGGGGGGGGGWVDPRATDPRAGAAGMDPRDLRPDPRDMRAGSTDPMRMLDPRDSIRLVSGDMRGDPRGITGRLNGAGTEGFWTQPPQGPHHMHQPGARPGGGGGGGGGGGNGAGWEEPSPPSQRRNVPYDDGTSVWSSHAQQPRGMTGSGANLSQWKDLPTGGSMGRGGAGPPGMAPSRLKPDGSVWGHGARNGSWQEGGGQSTWDESSIWPKQKLISGPIWDTDMEWSHKQGPKQGLTKELIWNSKEFRNLVDMGYKKEDVENALRMRGMSADDALDMLSSLRSNNMDGWRGHSRDDYDHQGSEQFPGQFPGQRFPPGPSAHMPFPPGTNTSNILNNLNASSGGNGGGNAPNSANNTLINMPPAFVQKMLTQSGGQPFSGGQATSARPFAPAQSQPSTQQLRMLVQQIQMAVQAGYLNHQILNQPLAPQTLVLLNQLLQQIKNLQSLVVSGKPSNMSLQSSVQITQTKQSIQNLQNQIAAQQAIYVKQQQHHKGGGSGGGNPGDVFKGGLQDMQGTFAELVLKDPQVQQPQSRLTQWKLPPTLDRDPLIDSNSEFSRAPGSVSKPMVPSHSSPNMNPLGLTQPDGPWSSGRAGDTGGWPDPNSGANDNLVGGGNPDPKETQWSAPVCQPSQPSLTDLVPEFEPGKPWKGTQIKSVEDDPTITPGSVARSPLSVGLKDTELFGSMNPSKLSPTGDSNLQPLSLSSSTWSFNPPSSTSSAFTSQYSKLPTSKGVLGDLNPPTAVTSELWAAPPLSKSRGPPPGLAKGGSGVNGWSGLAAGTGRASWGAQGTGGNWGSPWLLLRNLTAQIDGSTLRTLCMQHGPLQSFHLYLHQGFALAKYSSREEATKAQTALNNCVLGNTTILAESPTDWDANTLLQQVAPQQGASSGAWRGGGGGSTKQPVAGGDTWSTGWPTNPTTASLWGNAPLDTADQARATPSSLNSYLPGDLLGGESM